jgi:hypothetical protein
MVSGAGPVPDTFIAMANTLPDQWEMMAPSRSFSGNISADSSNDAPMHDGDLEISLDFEPVWPASDVGKWSGSNVPSEPALEHTVPGFELTDGALPAPPALVSQLFILLLLIVGIGPG